MGDCNKKITKFYLFFSTKIVDKLIIKKSFLVFILFISLWGKNTFIYVIHQESRF